MPTTVPYTLSLISHKSLVILVLVLQMRNGGSADTNERGEPGYEPTLSSFHDIKYGKFHEDTKCFVRS